MNSPVSIVVREATAADNILLANLGATTFFEAFAAANTPEDMAEYLPTAFSPEIQATELGNPENIFWLVYADEEVVGYVKLFTGLPAACISQSKALKIARLYLLNSWYGQGIGSALLYRIIGFARENEYSSVWLTVWEHNTRAIVLYQNSGFKIVGTEDFVLGQDVQLDYIMEQIIQI